MALHQRKEVEFGPVGVLEEETLSDGSVVYNILITELHLPRVVLARLSCTDKKHATTLFTALEDCDPI